MASIFGIEAIRSLTAATPGKQVKRIEEFGMYERGLIVHVQGLQDHKAEIKPAQPKPLRVKVNHQIMDGLKVGPSRTRLFRVHANTMEEAIQIALQEGYSHRQVRTPTSVWQGRNAATGAVLELITAVQNSIRCYGCEKLGHMQRACPTGGQKKFPSKPKGSIGLWQKPRPRSQWD
ncbi:Gag protein [Phytophthora palmivora]|uniref:Gag protein n=1 Tax=Phytophthora palmivora TaxID=4796 RepID=A0A2P4YT10_9STRA|nr:Gag protein [Phytophthora palmivora]